MPNFQIGDRAEVITRQQTFPAVISNDLSEEMEFETQSDNDVVEKARLAVALELEKKTILNQPIAEY